jgi:eukaryotic-like serine/threonine-protein kinase
MKECKTCRACFPDEIAFCPDDGAATTVSISGEPILDGRYNLERRLGQGGMGIVYKARHIFLKTQHAIKIILPDLVGNDPNLVTRFRQEALAAAAIRHQNIIAVTDFGVVRGTMPFLVMEFVQGRSLQEVLAEEGAMGPVRAFELMQPICAGIAAAHRSGIVHRDLKPLNVMIQAGMPIPEGTKILDFGLAKIKSGELLGSFIAAQTTGLMGSPFYMAPEQWSDEPPDTRADIYSIGVMLYQMLAGDVPFKANAIPAIMKKHLTEEVPTFSSRGVSIPPQIEAVVRHALEKEPEFRTPSAEEFLRELREAMKAASALLKKTGDAQIDPFKTISTPPPPQDTGRPSYVRPTSELVAAAISSSSLHDEAEKLRLAREELQREEENRRLAADQAARQRMQEEQHAEAERQRQLKAQQEKERQEAEKRAAEEQRQAEEQRKAEEQQRQLRLAEEEKRKAEEQRRRQEEDRLREEAQQARLREAREEARREEAARQEKVRLEEEQRRAEQARRDEERRRTEEQKRVDELVAQRTKAIEEKLTASSTAVADPEATHIRAPVTPARPLGATTMTENSYPTLTAQPSVATSKKNLLPYGIAAAILILLIGGGIGAYIFWPRTTSPTPAGPNQPPPERPVEVPPNRVAFTPEFIDVPGGTFQMGRNGATVAEVPVHPVTVKPFVIDKTEVTNYEYEQFVKETGHDAPSGWVGNKPIQGQELLPVTFVSYHDAVAFADWRSKRDKVKWRLPTEEEWEYAARGGDQDNIYPWGNNWSDENAITKSYGATMPKDVGSAANDKTRWGAMDMMGNVYEWTSTKANYYPGSTKQVEGEQKNWYVVRGASFSTTQDPKPISATRRDWFGEDTKVNVLGFRLVRSQ